jgi:spermidine synthase
MNRRAVLVAISFACGATCLVFELVWSRYLGLLFGVGAHAVATVLATFMVGLGLGSYLWGERADRSDRPERLLTRLLVATGAYVAVSPLLYHGAVAVAHAVVGSIGPSAYAKAALRVLLSAVALVPPTALMGGCIPVIVKLARTGRGRVERPAAWIYASNTLGAAVGAFLAGFVLIRSLGLVLTLEVGAVASLASAIASHRLVRSAPAPSPEPGRHDGEPASRLVAAVLAVYAVSGFTSLAYEVYWTRILTLFFKDSIYDLTVVLTVFLLGLVGGSLIGGRIATRTAKPVLALGIVEILIGLASLGGLALVSRLPYLINDLQTNAPLYDRYGDAYFTMSVVFRFASALALMIVPTTLFGATFPIVAGICAADPASVGRRIGLASALNTAGSALGALFAGFVFIATLGLHSSVVATASINALAGLVLVSLAPLPIQRRRALLGGTVAAVAGAALLLPEWDRLRMSTSFLEPNQPISDYLSLVYYGEDATGMTSVVDLAAYKRRYLVTNRTYAHNTSDLRGLEDHRRLGEIPVLLHPSPRTALVVGLGAGITLRGVVDMGVDSVDMVELSPGVVEAARYFSEENGHVLDSPRVHAIVDDGRGYVATTRKTYDVVVGDIMFPMSSGSTSLSSREYFDLVRRRLAPGGLYVQWLPAHQLDPAELRIAIATFQSVFPAASLWLGMVGESVPVVGCLGQNGAFAVDLPAIERRLSDAAIASRLREVNLGSACLLLSHFVMGPSGMEQMARGAPLNTDDRPVVEFLAPLHSVRPRAIGVANMVDLVDRAEDVGAVAPGAPARFGRCAAAKHVIIQGLRDGVDGHRDAQLRRYEAALAQDPENEDLRTSVGDLIERATE